MIPFANTVYIFCFFFSQTIVLGLAHTVALHSVALTLAQDPDQDPDLTLILPVDHGPVHAPMDGLIPALLILDVTDAVMVAHAQGPVHAQGLTVFGVLVPQGPLCPIGEEQPGRERKARDHTGRDPVLALQVPTGAVALVDERCHLLERQHLMN